MPYFGLNTIGERQNSPGGGWKQKGAYVPQPRPTPRRLRRRQRPTTLGERLNSPGGGWKEQGAYIPPLADVGGDMPIDPDVMALRGINDRYDADRRMRDQMHGQGGAQSFDSMVGEARGRFAPLHQAMRQLCERNQSAMEGRIGGSGPLAEAFQRGGPITRHPLETATYPTGSYSTTPKLGEVMNRDQRMDYLKGSVPQDQFTPQQIDMFDQSPVTGRSKFGAYSPDAVETPGGGLQQLFREPDMSRSQVISKADGGIRLDGSHLYEGRGGADTVRRENRDKRMRKKSDSLARRLGIKGPKNPSHSSNKSMEKALRIKRRQSTGRLLDSMRGGGRRGSSVKPAKVNPLEFDNKPRRPTTGETSAKVEEYKNTGISEFTVTNPDGTLSNPMVDEENNLKPMHEMGDAVLNRIDDISDESLVKFAEAIRNRKAAAGPGGFDWGDKNDSLGHRVIHHILNGPEDFSRDPEALRRVFKQVQERSKFPVRRMTNESYEELGLGLGQYF